MTEEALAHVVRLAFNQIADMTNLPLAVRRAVLLELRFAVMEAVYQEATDEETCDWIAGEVDELLGNQRVSVCLRVQIVNFIADELLGYLNGSPGQAAD